MDFRRFIQSQQSVFSLQGLAVHLARFGLKVLSFPYAFAAGAKNLAYSTGIKHTFRSPLPVISVGNLSVGGTGKSPAVAWIARLLREHNLRVAILSRGYGALDDGQNDEALELELQFPDVPHLQHWDRVASAKLAEEELDMQVIVLDDGFQHRRIARNFDLVLIDATDSPGAMWQLPGGLLRESLRNLRRADAVLLTRSDQASPMQLERIRQIVMRYVSAGDIYHAEHRPRSLTAVDRPEIPLDSLAGQKVVAFCGIGNPASFFASLRSVGATLIATRQFPDHHAYDADDVHSIGQWCSSHAINGATRVICTVKDWVKLQCREMGGLPLEALVVEMRIDRADSLGQQIVETALGSNPPPEEEA